MRNYVCVLLLLIAINTNANTYYVSNAGNDANDGLTPSTPWKTLLKISSYTGFVAGDAILFNRGEVFYGQLVINKSGVSGNPITIGAYGTGNNPIITGLTAVDSWTNIGGNIWESTSAVSALPTMNMVVINGVNTPMGRYPNTGCLAYQSFSSNTSITSSSLNSGVTDWTGAEAVIEKNDWTIDRCLITNHSGATITYTSLGSTSNGTARFGVFIQNDVRTLDVQNEWYYNPSTNKIRIYSTFPPTNVQVPTVTNLLTDFSFDYVIIQNINFTGSNEDALYFGASNCDNVTIQNCNISFAGLNGITMTGSRDIITNNTISNVGRGGILKNGSSSTITSNTLINIGIIPGQSFAGNSNRGIHVSESVGPLIQYNVLRNIGGDGISASSNVSGIEIRNNFIDSAMIILNDGGGIYTGGASTGRIINGNIVTNSMGSMALTPDPNLARGIYLDELASAVTVTNNTIANCGDAGIMSHKSNTNIINNNTCYNNKNSQIEYQDAVDGIIKNNIQKNNIFVSRTSSQYVAYFTSVNNQLPTFFSVADSNYYARPIDDNLTFRTYQANTNYVNRTLSGWQTLSGQDANSNQSPKIITDVNDLRFEYNATSSNKTISLNANYIDAKNTSYNGTITLLPYTSAVLIKNTNQSPKANAGSDQTITLPTNSVSLSGSGTDADGTISSYDWTKISGPAPGTITNADSTSTTVTGLVQGVYQFELDVTDNFGAIGSDTIQITVNSPWIPPTVNAGLDQSITLPVNAVTLSGSASDPNPNGTITVYSWVKISGPPAGTITNPASAVTSVTGLTLGVYQFELDVTDNHQATGSGIVQITVNPANIPPTVDAGPDRLISLPVNTFLLNGDAADIDGTISVYSWRKISGPSGETITDPTSDPTTVTGLVQGIYRFELKVTDDDGATAKDTVQLIVNAPPTANAGADQIITLPTNTVSLTGSGTDVDGSISSYTWTQVSGPSPGTITDASSPSTIVTDLEQGVYVFQLKVTDDTAAIGRDTIQVTVNAANIPPTANAGVDQTITLPTNNVNLAGSGADADGSISAYNWTEISGPSCTITNATSPGTSITTMAQGVYLLELKVTDDNGATAKDTMQVTVIAANIPPIAGAGVDQTITLPTSNVNLAGSGADADGSISAYNWTEISGPSCTITNATSPGASVATMTQGVYQFELKVTDNNGATAKDTMQVTVNAANIPPTAGAGVDQTITLPTSNVNLAGSGADADGSISAYSWTEISGPSCTITNATSPGASVATMTQGVYQFELKVTDNNGATAKDTMQVTVNAANIPPTDNAGVDQLITLPTNSVSLTGSGADTDGTIASYNWTKISGPSCTMTNATSPGASVTTMAQGVYQFELKVTDNGGATAKDTTQVIVNVPPTDNAGVDQTITLPVSTVTLSGSGADPDGTISSYNWTRISGPSCAITNATSPGTSVTVMIQGVYQFELKVTDNNGATAKDTMKVTVNVPPTDNAGVDQTITLPVNTVTLSGSGTDPDGTIASYNWTKISGPSCTMTNATSPGASVTAMTQGIYQFELKVTDNNGATAKDTMQVTVNAANIPPTAIAGVDQLITLPTNSVSLNGSGTDPDGTISSYNWTKISGPSCTITNATSPGASVTTMTQGVYQFELKVTDNNGATAKDTMQVTVNVPPTDNAGVDQTITLPVSTVTLSGSGADTDGTIASYNWTKISGPSCTMTNATSPGASVTTMAQGVYQFELKVTDNNGATAKDTMQVTVNAANIPPTAGAGVDQTITLPTNNVNLAGSGADADGSISAYNWTKISGPSCTIINATSPGASVTAMTQGIYQFELKVTDNNGATVKDTMQVTVNVPPTDNAGIDQTITLPVSTITLSGTGTDPDGTISSYNWTRISGPSCSITNATSPGTSVTAMTQGIYQFELKVTDNNGATVKDTIQVTVNAANIPPTTGAGVDQLITLPTNNVNLAGSGADADGTISAYNWTKISGPSCTITNATSPGASVTTMTQGVYQFELKVTDNNGATAKDTMQVIVNVPPTDNAGVDQTITLPVNTVTLSGSGTDPDGTISSYNWTRISGPSCTITNATSPGTSVTAMIQGIYQFELKVTDNNGATVKDTMKVTVNVPPTDNAGVDQTITLPVNTVTLSGTGTDPDGTIASYNWTKISGPSCTMTNATSPGASVTTMAQGVYQFELKVTDNNGATAKDTMQVTVNAANIPPTAIAGVDQLITLPTNSVSLNGSGTDPDGTISSYNWTKISGPSCTITNATSPGASVTAMTQGIYQFELKVTDNNGATAKDTMQVIVNVPPTDNAGVDQTITLPVSTVALSGTGTDPDGTISSYNWTKISGPSCTITNATSPGTSVTAMIQGIYQFELKVTDNNGATVKDTMKVTVNVPPTANAGSDQAITLPTNSVNLAGSGADTDGTISAYSWTRISGPAAGTITNTAAASTTVTALLQGVYKYQLQVTDNNGGIALDTVQITVNAANIPPTVNAGVDQLITLPTNSVSLNGSGADPDGTISAYNWTKISGPSCTITNATSPGTSVTVMAQGVYQFELKVTDNNGATVKDTMQVTVNVPPTDNAGVDQAITLPVSTVTLSGSGTDPDGTISSYSWTMISGSTATITSATSASTTVTALVKAVYKFQLKVTDNKGATALDTVQITVNAANIAPVAHAGTDQTITLPTNNVNLAGSGTDADGTISAYSWTKISGPASGTITSATLASTTVTTLVQGIYQFELKVTDNNGGIGKDTVQVTVNAHPIANAGVDQLITLPLSTVTLSGSGSDPDGTISAYSWTKISGSTATITNATSASTTVTALVRGVYKFQLKVTDNRGGTGVDTVQITVNAAPVGHAGADQTITLPASSATLSGSGTDVDGTVSAYSWTKLSGPASGTITSATSASTTVTAMVQGIYQFELKVTDNSGGTGKDTIQVTVNVPPTAHAGIDQLISLPVSTVTLSGSGTDPDGTISAYSWTKISGSTATITSATLASTTVTALVKGVYKFQLKVTDNRGATALDTVQITVNAAPVSHAGTDQVITLPTSTVTLSGSGTDADGTISAYSWTKISGSTATITSAASASTTVTALVQGVYKFQLKVTDDKGATGLDTVQITVNPANIAPTAHAGVDQTITLPTNTVTLSGSGTDPDGTISAYSWTKISGSTATITSATSASTTVKSLVQGVYKFQLTVTDNKGATGKDTIQVTVAQSLSGLNLVTFKAQPAGDNVNLTWITANEKNISGFDIEKKTVNSWKKIGNIQSNAGLSNKYFFEDNRAVTGLNYYRLKAAGVEGKFIYSGIINAELKRNEIIVYQNVPNPFSATTTIKYEMGDEALVKIVVYNTLGIPVAVLANEIKKAGSYQVEWNAGNRASGTYYYKVIIGDKVKTMEMLKLN